MALFQALNVRACDVCVCVCVYIDPPTVCSAVSLSFLPSFFVPRLRPRPRPSLTLFPRRPHSGVPSLFRFGSHIHTQITHHLSLPTYIPHSARTLSSLAPAMLHFWLPLLVALCSLSVLLGAPLPNERREDARTGLLNALRNANLNQFAQALSANSGVLDAIVSSPGKKFILGPTDEAMASLPRWVTRHQEVLQSTLLHHVLNGSFDPNSFVGPPLHTLGHSLLTSDKHVQLPGGNGQAVAMGKAENGTFVAEAVNQDRFQAGTSTWNEFQIQPIQHAITIPGAFVLPALVLPMRRDRG